jgi:hypothetical protein
VNLVLVVIFYVLHDVLDFVKASLTMTSEDATSFKRIPLAL